MLIEELRQQIKTRHDITPDNKILVYDTVTSDINYSKESPHFKNMAKKYGDIIGVLSLNTRSYDDVAVVDDIYIHSDYRGIGIGIELYKRAYEYAKSKKRILGSFSDMRTNVTNKIWIKAGFITRDDGLDIMTGKPR